MLKLKGIKKDYITGETVVHALKGIDLNFRESEFVAVLGHSGCGKTTLLNIIGGLDTYSEGDLVINGIREVTQPSTLHSQFSLLNKKYLLNGRLVIEKAGRHYTVDGLELR